MARNRQRSKQRQAERRARRLQEQGGAPPPRQDRGDVPGVTPAPIDPGPPGVDADHLAVGAPPEEEGRTDFVLAHEEGLLDREEYEAALDDDEAASLADEEEAYERIEDWETAGDYDDPDAAVADG